MNWAWGVKLQPSVKLVLLKLADRANDDGECWPGQSSIADECCISKNTLIRHIKELQAIGLVSISKRKTDEGKQATNVYQLHLDRQPGAKLAPGKDEEPGAKSDENRVPTVAPVLKEEPTVLTHNAHAQACARDRVGQEPIVADAVRFIEGRWVVDDAVFDGWIIAYQAGRTHRDTEDWIESELAKAALWFKTDKGRRKLAHLKDLLRFMNNWLTRASDPPKRKQVQQSHAYH